MLKKFNSLGTAISRNEAKMVVGGNIAVLVIDSGGEETNCDNNCEGSGACTTSSGGSGTCNNVLCVGSNFYFKTCS